MNYSSLGTKRSGIEGAHNRAISLYQLRQVLKFIDDYADNEGFLPWYDSRNPSRKKLHKNNVNLYHVNDWIICPSTKPFECSFVELICPEETLHQKPRWFISHFWGEPVRDFILAVEKHAEVRGLSEHDFWWCCAYSNNQHELTLEIHPDPRETSFFRAMQESEGVLLILDANATPFTRIWCCFEEAVAMRGEKDLKFDVATVIDGKANILTQGLTEKEEAQEAQFIGSGYYQKSLREQGFNLSIMEKAYDINIAQANSSRSEDKKRILNAINKVSPHELDILSPDLSHPEIKLINSSLSSLFGESALHLAAQTSPERFEIAAAVIGRNKLKKTLDINLQFCSGLSTIYPIESLLNTLVNLDTLSINLIQCTSLSDISPISRSLHNLACLRRLTCNFIQCNFTNCEEFANSLTQLPKIQELSLAFSTVNDIQRLSHSIAGMNNLQSLLLSFNTTPDLNDVSPVAEILISLSNLKTFFLGLNLMQKKPSLKSICKALSETKNKFEKFSIHLMNHKHPEEIASLAKALKRQHHIQYLNLYLPDVILNVEDLNIIWDAIASMAQISTLILEFSNLPKLRSLIKCTNALKGKVNLAHLRLKLRSCPQLKDIASIANVLQSFSSLRSLELDFWNCQKLNPDCIKTLGKSLREFTSSPDLSSTQFNFYLDLEKCSLLDKGLQRKFSGENSLTSFCDASSPSPLPYFCCI